MELCLYISTMFVLPLQDIISVNPASCYLNMQHKNTFIFSDDQYCSHERVLNLRRQMTLLMKQTLYRPSHHGWMVILKLYFQFHSQFKTANRCLQDVLPPCFPASLFFLLYVSRVFLQVFFRPSTVCILFRICAKSIVKYLKAIINFQNVNLCYSTVTCKVLH